VPKSIGNPFGHLGFTEALLLHAQSVEHWVPHEIVLVSFFEGKVSILRAIFRKTVFLVLVIENCKPDDWERSKGNVVHLVNYLLVKRLAREGRGETKVELSNNVYHVFVERVEDE